jgi:hypothetical protein
MRAHRRIEIENAAKEAGFNEITWQNANESGYFQSIMMARKLQNESKRV